MKELVIITGLSGSGKSLAARCFEDLGYFCVDNLPVALIEPFHELLERTGDQLKRAALVVDIREGTFLKTLPETLTRLMQAGAPVQVLFFECTVEVLTRRFSESRRPHPMQAAAGGALEEAIRREREALAPLREMAERIIDTSRFTAHELRQFLQSSFGETGREGLNVNVQSFGFKYGVPAESDLVFDVRFLPNPYFVPELRPLDGRSQKVRDFLGETWEKQEFVDRLKNFLEFLIPLYASEGKAYLTVSLGCTGGKHRSVALAEELKAFLGENQPVNVKHRDLGRE